MNELWEKPAVGGNPGKPGDDRKCGNYNRLLVRVKGLVNYCPPNIVSVCAVVTAR